MSGRNPSSYCTNTLTAIQGHLRWVVIYNLIGYSKVKYSSMNYSNSAEDKNVMISYDWQTCYIIFVLQQVHRDLLPCFLFSIRVCVFVSHLLKHPRLNVLTISPPDWVDAPNYRALIDASDFYLKMSASVQGTI